MAVREKWQAYVEWLGTNVPAAHANLAPPATDEDLAQVESATGLTLPDGLKELWRCNNGQKVTMISTSIEPCVPCIPTLSFLSTRMVIEVWKQWAGLRAERPAEELASLQAMGESVIPETVQPLYTHPAWIPLWADPTRADYIGLDLEPGPKGAHGQLINFGRNEEKHLVVASGLAELLDILLEEVRGGGWRADTMDYGDDEIEWFGDPDESFFNPLQNRVRARLPKPPKTPKQQLAEMIDAAEKQCRAKAWEPALATLVEIRALLPEPGMRTLEVEAKALEGLERWDDLDRVLAQQIELFPHMEGYFVKRATNLIDKLGDRARAAEVIRAGLVEHPEDEDLLELQQRAT